MINQGVNLNGVAPPTTAETTMPGLRPVPKLSLSTPVRGSSKVTSTGPHTPYSPNHQIRQSIDRMMTWAVLVGTLALWTMVGALVFVVVAVDLSTIEASARSLISTALIVLTTILAIKAVILTVFSWRLVVRVILNKARRRHS